MGIKFYGGHRSAGSYVYEYALDVDHDLYFIERDHHAMWSITGAPDMDWTRYESLTKLFYDLADVYASRKERRTANRIRRYADWEILPGEED